MPDSLSNPNIVRVPLANPPDKAPGRLDVLYDHESTPATRAKAREKEEINDRPRQQALERILADTVAPAAVPDTLFMPWSPALMHEMDAPVTLRSERGDCGRHEIEYRHGIRPEDRPMLPGYDSATVALLMAVFLLIAANFRHFSTFLKTFAHDLWSTRRRNFSGDHTLSETRVVGSLVLLACVCEGIIAFSFALAGSARIFVAIISAVAVAAAYYIWQLAAYYVTAYAFATKTVRRQWLKGFNASQALMGLALVVPALLSLFNPALVPAMCILSVVLYFAARILFISKGFRLFYENFGSLLYFILYLCALEIAPLLMLSKLTHIF